MGNIFIEKEKKPTKEQIEKGLTALFERDEHKTFITELVIEHLHRAINSLKRGDDENAMFSLVIALENISIGYDKPFIPSEAIKLIKDKLWGGSKW